MMVLEGNNADRRAQFQGAPGVFWIALIALCFGAQWVAMLILPADGPAASVRRLLVVVTTLLAVAAAVRFRWLLGAWLIAAGIALNLLPILANGGLMPVAWETVQASGEFPQITADQVGSHIPGSKDILLPRDEIRLEPLADRFVVDAPFLKTHVYSAGDFVLLAGIGLVMLELLAWVATGSFPAARLLRRALSPASA